MYSSARPAKYRHVVFADEVGGAPRALDLAPPPPPPPVPAPPAGAFEADLPPANPPADAAAPLSYEERALLAWVFAQGGLDVRDYKPETLRRRLPALYRVVRARDCRSVQAALRAAPSLVQAALNALVIGVTSFFRDPTVFAHLAETVVPELARRGDAAGPRVWSAGCSDGSELYSVGILLAEAGAAGRCSLLGTDCRGDAVRQAAAGAYDAAAAQSVPPPLLDRYFARAAGSDGAARWHVAPALRAVAQFRRADVLSIVEPGPFDLILCRNMSIYLQPAAVERLWRSLEAALRPGGTLVLGKAERPHGATNLVPTHPGVYRRARG